jgi:hypothetical protein
MTSSKERNNAPLPPDRLRDLERTCFVIMLNSARWAPGSAANWRIGRPARALASAVVHDHAKKKGHAG